MKLRVVDKNQFDAWRDAAIKEVHSRYGEDEISLLNIQELDSSLLDKDVRQIEISTTATIEEVIYHLTGEKRLTAKESGDRKITIERQLYCLSVSNEALEPAKTLDDYDLKNDDLLLLREHTLRFRGPSGIMYRASLIRDITDFCRIVRSVEDIEESPGLLFRPPPPPEDADMNYLISLMVGSMMMGAGIRPVESILLYTDEDPELAKYIRYNFAALDELTGHHLNVYAIEQPTQVQGISAKAYWRAQLEINVYSFLNLMGWTRYKPYNKAEVYKIANTLRIYPDAIPCMVLFGNIKSDEKIVISVIGEFGIFFRKVSSIVLRTFEKAYSAKIKLHDNFPEFKRTFLEEWDEWQREIADQERPSSTFIFNGQTVFINRPSGNTTIRDFQKGEDL